MQLDERDIKSLNDVRLHAPDFVRFLEKSRAFIYTQMEATADTNELHALRGEARVMTRLLREINDSHAASERLEMARRQR